MDSWILIHFYQYKFKNKPFTSQHIKSKMIREYYKGKSILITGTTGFVGKYTSFLRFYSFLYFIYRQSHTGKGAQIFLGHQNCVYQHQRKGMLFLLYFLYFVFQFRAIRQHMTDTSLKSKTPSFGIVSRCSWESASSENSWGRTSRFCPWICKRKIWVWLLPKGMICTIIWILSSILRERLSSILGLISQLKSTYEVHFF